MRCQYLLLSLLACFMAAALPAQARTRDDVVGGAFRCSVVADTRQWLDCYYGAAQPVRASLGLPPAPAAQIRLAQQPPAGGQPTDDVLREQVTAAASRCYDIGDDHQWLNCYYAAVQPVRAELGLAAAPGVTDVRPADRSVPVAAAPPPVGADQLFGMTARVAGNVNRISARMVSCTVDPTGLFSITLDNGQVWQELPGDTDRLVLRHPPNTYMVKIARGMLGSYNLQVQGLAQSFKVQRAAKPLDVSKLP